MSIQCDKMKGLYQALDLYQVKWTDKMKILSRKQQNIYYTSSSTIEHLQKNSGSRFGSAYHSCLGQKQKVGDCLNLTPFKQMNRLNKNWIQIQINYSMAMASVFFSYLSFILFFLYKFKFILWTTPTSKKTVHLYVDVKKSGYIYSKELAM